MIMGSERSWPMEMEALRGRAMISSGVLKYSTIHRKSPESPRQTAVGSPKYRRIFVL